ncbi:ABC transporter ATP-binding protein, partial [Bacillus mycoides]
ALGKVGLSDRFHHLPSELSGGQKQRVAIARSIANNPKFIMADEPTGALDTKSSEQIMNIFTNLNIEGTTIVMITHEEEVADYSSRRIVLRDGKITEDRRYVI